jgi:hypothetical protein
MRFGKPSADDPLVQTSLNMDDYQHSPLCGGRQQ